MLFAQGSENSINMWAPVVGGGINAIFSIVVGWYLLTKSIPESQEKFNNAIAEQRKDFLATQEKLEKNFRDTIEKQEVSARTTNEKQEANFRTMMEAYRTWFDTREIRLQDRGEQALKVVVEHCEREAARRDEMVKSELSIVNLTMKNVMEALEEVRESLRELCGKKDMSRS